MSMPMDVGQLVAWLGYSMEESTRLYPCIGVGASQSSSPNHS